MNEGVFTLDRGLLQNHKFIIWTFLLLVWRLALEQQITLSRDCRHGDCVVMESVSSWGLCRHGVCVVTETVVMETVSSRRLSSWRQDEACVLLCMYVSKTMWYCVMLFTHQMYLYTCGPLKGIYTTNDHFCTMLLYYVHRVYIYNVMCSMGSPV